MITNKRLTINGKKLVLFIVYFTFIMETLIAEFKFQEFIRYFNDIALLLLIFFLIKTNFYSRLKETKFLLVFWSIVIFFIVCVISAIVNLVPFRLFIWAFRNTFRGMILLIGAVTYIKKEDLHKIFNVLFYIQIVNLILALYQFFILKHKMDNVGGIFGYGNGAGVNLFNAVLISYYLNACLAKKEKISKLIFVLTSSFIIAAIAEEKMTYLLVGVIGIVSILLTKISVRKVLAIILLILSLIGGLQLMKYYYPNMYEILVNIDKMNEYAVVSAGYKIPRIGAFKVISDNFFGNSIKNKALGLGFGNCETSKMKIFQSDFYQRNGKWGYRFFTHQWIFLETGYLGFISYLSIFISILICLIKNKKSKEFEGKEYICTSICMAVCSIIIIWYNPTLKIDMSYLAYFYLAIGFIACKIKENVLTKSKEYI